MRLASKAREWQRLADAVLKVVQNLLHPLASIPDGPAAPIMRRAAVRIIAASMLSNTTGCTSDGASSLPVGWVASAVAGWLVGC